MKRLIERMTVKKKSLQRKYRAIMWFCALISWFLNKSSSSHCCCLSVSFCCASILSTPVRFYFLVHFVKRYFIFVKAGSKGAVEYIVQDMSHSVLWCGNRETAVDACMAGIRTLIVAEFTLHSFSRKFQSFWFLTHLVF